MYRICYFWKTTTHNRLINTSCCLTFFHFIIFECIKTVAAPKSLKCPTCSGRFNDTKKILWFEINLFAGRLHGSPRRRALRTRGHAAFPPVPPDEVRPRRVPRPPRCAGAACRPAEPGQQRRLDGRSHGCCPGPQGDGWASFGLFQLVVHSDGHKLWLNASVANGCWMFKQFVNMLALALFEW